MLKLTKRYFTLKKICKRYGVKLKLHSNEGQGSFTFSIPRWGERKFNLAEIKVCLWDDALWEIYFHELGHLLDAKRTRGYEEGVYNNLPNFDMSEDSFMKDYIKDKNLSNYSSLIICEARASRIAVKLLKTTGKLQKGSVSYLTRCFSPYSRGVCKQQIADVDYKYIQYIKGTRVN